jgi:drug/metabolite transporter (DMT)-like permease
MDTAPRSSAAVEGTQSEGFRLLDWGHVGLTAVIFGSAFLWIALALRSLSPGVIGFSRVALGAGVLLFFSQARVLPHRKDWTRIVIAGCLGQAAPAILFAMAEQRISSSLTGMLMSAIPMVTAVLAALVTRHLPSRTRVVGLSIGIIGIGLLSLPALRGAGAEVAGVAMVLLAVLGYSSASMIYAPLQQRYGTLAVVMWTLAVASVVLLPFGILGLDDSSFELLPVVALVILGVLGTGVARSLMVAAIGRLGSVRASIIAYLVPIVALALGVIVLDETVAAVQIAGAAIAIVGGYLISRAKNTAA